MSNFVERIPSSGTLAPLVSESRHEQLDLHISLHWVGAHLFVCVICGGHAFLALVGRAITYSLFFGTGRE